jgi:hypothetical protein
VTDKGPSMKPSFRTRSVGTKVTDEEYAHLEACATDKELSISEWCRTVLLERAKGSKANGADETLLAEVLALRMILLNLHFKVAKGQAISADEMQAIIERADQEKRKKATERLAIAGEETQ